MTTTSELIRVFGRIGLLSFGGPAAQIALMHRALVEERDWLSESQFLRALSFCMLLPGPEAMQLATYAGWRKAGIVGGLIGGGLFVVPGALVIGLLALAYAVWGDVDWMQALFVGVQAAVVVIVIEALIKVSKRALKSMSHIVIAILAFLALFLFAVPFPIVIAVAAIYGAITTKDLSKSQIQLGQHHPVRIIGIGIILWAAPVCVAMLMNADLLVELGLFFSKLAVVTFGGAYAVLAYMTQDVVNTQGWLTTSQMMDALGLAETTPGPLILVTQFVGMLTGYFSDGVGTAIWAGLITLWVTFVPCFIWIFAGAPLIDWLDGRPRLRGALAAITAAVVGVIANLSIWFATHVFFADVTEIKGSWVQTILPVWSSLQLTPLALALLAAVLILWRHWNLLVVLAICAGLGLLYATL